MILGPDKVRETFGVPSKTQKTTQPWITKNKYIMYTNNKSDCTVNDCLNELCTE